MLTGGKPDANKFRIPRVKKGNFGSETTVTKFTSFITFFRTMTSTIVSHAPTATRTR